MARNPPQPIKSNKEKQVDQNIKLFGYESMKLDDLMKEAGKMAFELIDLKTTKKDTMKEMNERIKAFEDRLDALKTAVSAHRTPIRAVSSK